MNIGIERRACRIRSFRRTRIVGFPPITVLLNALFRESFLTCDLEIRIILPSKSSPYLHIATDPDSGNVHPQGLIFVRLGRSFDLESVSCQSIPDTHADTERYRFQ